VAAACALVVGAVYWDWKQTRERGEARRDEIVRRLDAEDPGWRSVDLCKARNRCLPPDERNGAAVAVRAVTKLPQEYGEWQKARLASPRSDPEPGVRLADDDLRERAGVHAKCADALALARSVRALSPGGNPLTFREDNPVGTLLPFTQEMRGAGQVLDLDATVLAHGGRADDALSSVHGILACGRALGDEPTLVSQLVRIAIDGDAVRATERVLGWGRPTRGLAELQAAFADEKDVPRLSYGFRGERAMLFTMVDCIDRRRVPLSDLRRYVNSLPGTRVEFILYRKHLPAQQAMITELFTDALAADRLSGPARLAAFDAIRSKVPAAGDETELVRLLQPSFSLIVLREERNRAELGCAVTALACDRYRIKFGRWPDTLAAIPKDILPAVPADPFTGDALHYRVGGGGAVISSSRPPQSFAFVPPWPQADKDLWAPVEFRLVDPARRDRPAILKDTPPGDAP
jgi:hypothetical protein